MLLATVTTDGIGGNYFMCSSVIEKDQLLEDLRNNICTDNLNQSDTSVGLYPVSDLIDWAKTDAKDCYGIEILSVTKDDVVFVSEDRWFKIFRNGSEVDGNFWDIAPFVLCKNCGAGEGNQVSHNRYGEIRETEICSDCVKEYEYNDRQAFNRYYPRG
jgi:hypothetical protein